MSLTPEMLRGKRFAAPFLPFTFHLSPLLPLRPLREDFLLVFTQLTLLEAVLIRTRVPSSGSRYHRPARHIPDLHARH